MQTTKIDLKTSGTGVLIKLLRIYRSKLKTINFLIFLINLSSRSVDREGFILNLVYLNVCQSFTHQFLK